MNIEQRLMADYHIASFSVGKHPLAYKRAELQQNRVLSLREAKACKAGQTVRIAGEVVARQRPGPAKGIIFMTLHDETGYCDAGVMPDLYDSYRISVNTRTFLIVSGEFHKVQQPTQKGA